MKNVRLGIIGMGNIGRFHASYLTEGKVPGCELTAVCSTSPAKLKEYGDRGVYVFGDAAELIRSRAVDAVLIATPHFQHPALAMAAFENGLHVMCEKPIAAHKADAECLIAAQRKKPDLVFAVMFQFRASPCYTIIRQLVQDGVIGEVVRVNWINTDWFRTEAYYASGGWRATWKGEGGGVLLNQCPHNLDTLQWICGMPKRVRGFCQLGRFHRIEVEDNVTAWMEWENGATGVFISSTGEAPGTNRLEIAGTRGKLVLENDKLTLSRNDADMVEFSQTAQAGFLKPGVSQEEIPFAREDAPHAVLLRNFADAILTGRPLLAPGKEGLHSLELANAILHSSLCSETIELPMDGAAWEKKLNELIASSARKGS